MKEIPRNFRALSRWSFSCDHFCFSLSLAFLLNFVQSSGRKWSGQDVVCRCVSLFLDQIFPFGGFFPLCKSSETWPRIRQISWPIDIPIIIDASLLHDIQVRTCSSGDVNVLQWNKEFLSASKAWIWVQRDGGIWRFVASPASENESWGGGRDPSDSPRKSLWLSPRIGWSRVKVDVLSSWSPPTNLIRPPATGNMIFPFSLGNIASFALSLLVDFWCVHRFQLLKCLQPLCHPSKFPPRTERIQGTIQVRLSFQIDGFLTGLWQK